MTAQIPGAEIVESLSEAWGVSLLPVGCPNCQRAFLIPADRVGQFCPRCAAGSLTPQPVRIRPEAPELAIPFQQTRAFIKPALERFVNELWLRPADFTFETISNRMVPIYLPIWLVDSTVKGVWQAEAGFNYQVKSSQDSYQSGEWRSREVVETRSNWEKRAGTIDRTYQNISAPAMKDQAAVLDSLGGFDYRQSQKYHPDQIAQSALLVPDLPPEDAWPYAKTALERTAEEDCRTAAGADHIRNYQVKASFSNLTWTQLLVPAFASFYKDDDGQPHPVYINGQNGRISGDRVASQQKGWRMAGISAAIGIGIFLLSLLCFSLAVLFPPASALGVLGVIVAIGLGIFAVVPAVYPWQWNRKIQGPRVTSR